MGGADSGMYFNLTLSESAVGIPGLSKPTGNFIIATFYCQVTIKHTTSITLKVPGLIVDSLHSAIYKIYCI